MARTWLTLAVTLCLLACAQPHETLSKEQSEVTELPKVLPDAQVEKQEKINVENAGYAKDTLLDAEDDQLINANIKPIQDLGEEKVKDELDNIIDAQLLSSQDEQAEKYRRRYTRRRATRCSKRFMHSKRRLQFVVNMNMCARHHDLRYIQQWAYHLTARARARYGFNCRIRFRFPKNCYRRRRRYSYEMLTDEQTKKDV